MIALVLVLVGATLAACASPGAGGNAAIVNGTPVPMSTFDKQVNLMRESLAQSGVDPKSPQGQQTLNQVREDVLNQLIDTELLRQAAAREGITVSDADVDERVKQIIQDVGGDAAFKEALRQDKLTMEEFRTLIVRDQMIYERMFEKLTSSLPVSAEQVHVRHILVETEQEALDIQAQLTKGADFAALAKEKSQDTYTKDTGGDLGFFPRGALDETFEKAAFALKINDIAVVKTDFGYHVLQVLEKEANRALPAEYVQNLRDEAIALYIDDLRSQAVIEKLVKLAPSPTPSQ